MHKVLPNGQIVYEEDYSCIIQPQNGKGGIFIGNLEAAQNIKTLKKHGIKAILTAAKGVDLTHSKADVPYYLQVPGQDREGFDLTRFFPQSINFIKDALDTTNIMVHCLAGVSRSVCLVLAYFIRHKGLSYDEAYNLVKTRRSIIHPNDGFISQLRKFQNELKAAGMSPSKYDNMHNRLDSNSPTKKRYEYYDQQQFGGNNPQMHQQLQRSVTNNYYISPTKRSTIETYVPTYQSPSKKTFQQLVNESYESRNKSIMASPTRRRFNETTRQIYETNETSKYQYLNGFTQRQSRFDMKHISPDKKRTTIHIEQRGRSITNTQTQIQPKFGGNNIQAKRLFGNYDRLRHTSAAELSQQLDSKIAAIREKYSQYTKNQMNKTRRVGIHQQRVNNFMDENDLGLSATLGLRKITSEYEGLSSKLGNGDYGIIKNNLERSNIGLGLRKLNSMRDGGY